MAEVTTKTRRGHYVARLDGDDPKMGLAREFMSGRRVKSRHVFVHDLAPGYYELQAILPLAERPPPCGECGTRNDGKHREYFAVTNADEIRDLTKYAGEMGRISVLPPLGDCECKPNGESFAYCELHTPLPDVKADAPDDAPF